VDYVSHLLPQVGLLFIPHVKYVWAWRTMVDDVDWEKLPICPPESSPAILPAELSSNKSQEDLGEGNYAFCLPNICSYSQRPVTCCNILRHGASGFTLPSKEGVLRIFIGLINPSPQQGLKLRALGPMASTLTITPQRRLTVNVSSWSLFPVLFSKPIPVELIVPAICDVKVVIWLHFLKNFFC
jgi:hypothetical protein